MRWRDTFYPVHNSDGKVQWVGVIVTEVTERMRSEEALRRSEKLAAAGRLLGGGGPVGVDRDPVGGGQLDGPAHGASLSVWWRRQSGRT